MVEIFAAGVAVPVGVGLEQFDVEAVESPSGADVEGVFGDLADGGDAGQREEEGEVIRKVLVLAGERRDVGGEVFGVQLQAVGGEDELSLVPGRRGAVPQGSERSGHLTGRCDLDVDIAALENPADVGLVRVAGLEAFEGGLLVAERLEKGVGELRRHEGRFGEVGDGFFDLDCVHGRGRPRMRWNGAR